MTGPTVFFVDDVGGRRRAGPARAAGPAYDEQRICRERDPDWTRRRPAARGDHPGRAGGPADRRAGPAHQPVHDAHAEPARAHLPVGAPTPWPRWSRRGVPGGRAPDRDAARRARGWGTGCSGWTPRGWSPTPARTPSRPSTGSATTASSSGQSLAEVDDVADARRRRVDEGLALVVTGRAPWRADLEASGATLACAPSRSARRRRGSARSCCCRDVSELRRRERELLSKDATIREIHHRVKNNLQTVAALLRLQSRRVDGRGGADGAGPGRTPGGRHRAGARDAVDRVRRDGGLRRRRQRGLSTLVEVARPGERVQRAADRVVRAAAGRGRHAAGAGADRAGARTRSSTGCRRPGRSWSTPPSGSWRRRARTGCGSRSATTAWGCRRRSTRLSGRAGHPDRPGPGARAGRHHRLVRPRRAAGTDVTLELRPRPLGTGDSERPAVALRGDRPWHPAGQRRGPDRVVRASTVSGACAVCALRRPGGPGRCVASARGARPRTGRPRRRRPGRTPAPTAGTCR